ncbi:MAG TPA: acyl-CoA thioesterase [Sandaracinaceae bacterium]
MSMLSRARPPADAAVIEGEVPFHDVDPLHIVWHGHYYKYLEVARTALFRRHRIDGPDLLELGYRFVIAHAECRYVSALRYGDRYRVSAWFLDTEQRVHVAYEVWNVTENRRSARARTALVTTDARGELLLVTPAVIRERIHEPLGAS